MRYIDISNLGIAADWVNLSKAENYNPTWSYLKVKFETLVGKKCWYNESINDGTSNPIDHYRPKADNVKILTTKYAVLDGIVWKQLSSVAQTGYPFLELDCTNYRYACGFANSSHTKESIDGITRGKSNFFPIEVGSIVATDSSEISKEKPALLDPCNPNDPKLLTFTEIGGIEPFESIVNGSWDYCRVKVSIEVYNLMYHVLIEKRKELWVETHNDIEILSSLYNKANKTDLENQSFNHIFKKFIKSLQKKSEYSAVVIDCVNYFKKRKDPIYYRWLHNILTNQLLTK